jgi:hypothetical protein
VVQALLLLDTQFHKEKIMAHFAQIDENNKVIQVIVVGNDDCGGGDFPASEAAGQAFIASIGLAGTWKQTSYNSNFRKHYAGVDFSYDPAADVFVAPQPFPSWTLDENHDWQPPTPRPDSSYFWDESKLDWVQIERTEQ